VDRVIVVDVQNGSMGQAAGFETGMVLLGADGKEIGSLDGLFNALKPGSVDLKMLNDGHEQNLRLGGIGTRGIMVASVFGSSPAENASLPAKSIITGIDGAQIGGLDGFRQYMNTTRPGQTISIATAEGRTYQVNLISKGGGIGFIGIGISGNAVYMGGVSFQEAPSRQFLQVLKAIPTSGLQGFTYLLGLPFAGIPGFTEKGFPGFSGWLTAIYEPIGWAKPLGMKFFWIANLLLWVGWINLYAGLFNCLPAVPLDGGHIFRDLVQMAFERVLSVRDAERLTRTVVAFLAWLVLTSLVITLVAPFTHWLSL